MQGGIIDKEMPIHVSNLALVCGKDGRRHASATGSTTTARSTACAASAEAT